MPRPGLPGPRIVRAVLKNINALRAAYALPPVQALLRGERGHLHRDPIARTLEYGPPHDVIGGSSMEYLTLDSRRTGTSASLRPSPTTQRFLFDFDRGVYPGLVLSGPPEMSS